MPASTGSARRTSGRVLVRVVTTVTVVPRRRPRRSRADRTARDPTRRRVRPAATDPRRAERSPQRRGPFEAGRPNATRRPREHCIANCLRNRTRSRRQHLADKERITGRVAIELVGVDLMRFRKPCNRLWRQGCSFSRAAAPRRQLAEHDAKRMGTIERIIPIARNHDRGRRAQPPAEQTKHIECPLVGPMHILDHNDSRHPGRKLARSAAATSCGRATAALARQARPRHLCDVDQRSSGRGVNSGSHEPQSTRAAPTSSQKRRKDGLPDAACRTRTRAGRSLVAHPGNPPGKSGQRISRSRSDAERSVVLSINADGKERTFSRPGPVVPPRRGCARSACAESPRRGDRPSSRTRRGVH